MRRLLALAVALAACTTPAAELSPSTTTDPSPGASQRASEIAEAISSDAKSRLPETFGNVEVSEIQSVVFQDASLDCPEEGVQYESGTVQGYRVVLETDGGHLVYKADQSGDFFLCARESSETVIEVMAGSDNGSRDGTLSGLSSSGLPEDLTKAISEDAASVAGVDVADVTLLEPRSELFADGSLGCPQKGSSYVQVQTPGWIVMVTAGSMNLEYHAAESGYFVLCS